jgi:Flp pilus assembly protein CpaB
MKPKTLVLMVVAVTCGLGASYMTSRLLAERQQEDVEKVQVLVAKRNLNMGETIKTPQDVFEFKEYTKGEEPRDAVREFDSLKGRILKIHRRAGDFVRPDDLLSSSDPAAAFTANLPSGYRAVGLRINQETSAAGWATLPLSRVDVINTVRRGDDRSTYSQFLLENVLVLAIDQGTQRTEGGQAMPGQVVIFSRSAR